MRLRNITFAALALIAAGCTNDNEPGTAGIDLTGQPMRVTTQVNAPQTRESMTTDDLTQYYLRITGNEGATTLYDYFTTMTKGATEWTPADELTWKDGTTPIEVSAVWQNGVTWTKDEYNGITLKTVSVLTDQNSEANVKASDLLYMAPTDFDPATLKAPYTIPVTLNHRFAKLNISILVNSSATENPISSVIVGGTQTQGTFNPTSDELSPRGTATNVQAYNFRNTSGTGVDPQYTAEYECILLPQTADFTVTANINNTNYTYVGNAQQFDPDRQYNLTLTVSGIGNSMNLGGATVDDWGSDVDLDDGSMGEDLGGYTIAEDGTYQVYNAQGLMAWFNKADEYDNLSINCTLMADINMTEQKWPTVYYDGTFDGQGHTISGLSGIFGLIYYNYGTIKNVTLLNPTVNSSIDAGLITSRNYGDIINCHVIGGSINSPSGDYSGSIVGRMDEGTVTACSSTANVSGGIGAGGIVGYFKGTITACYYANGSVTSSTENRAGSIVGSLNSSNLSACYWKSDGATNNYSHIDAIDVTEVTGDVTWVSAAEAMNAALAEAGYTDYRWVVNTGENADSRPLITEKATE